MIIIDFTIVLVFLSALNYFSLGFKIKRATDKKLIAKYEELRKRLLFYSASLTGLLLLLILLISLLAQPK